MTSRKKLLAIVNPRAAGGRTLKQWKKVSRILEQHFGPVKVRFTERSGHATALAREALEAGCDLIIAVGGDGTANEVANGFLTEDEPVRPDACLGFIPIGTGSDLQRTLCIPTDSEEAAAAIANGIPVSIDIGRAELVGHDGSPVRRYFVNLVSFGMGGDVSVRAKNLLSPLGGKTAFLYATFAVFLRYPGKRVRLTLNGVPQPEEFFITNVAIGNGRYHGGGMHPCPRAVMDDGLLEVTTIDRLSMFELIRDLPILYSDNIYQHPKVRHFRADRILAESSEVTRVEVDGEALGRLPLDIRVLPKRLRVLVPRDSPLLKMKPSRAAESV